MRYRIIVIATDFSEASLPAVKTGFRLAQDSEAEVYFLHVFNPPVGMDPMGTVAPSLSDLEEGAKSQLEGLVPEDTPEGVTVHSLVLRGMPTKTIAEFAQEKDADLIIVGTHGRTGLGRLFMGSTAEALLREAPCHVMVVKPRTTASVAAGE